MKDLLTKIQKIKKAINPKVEELKNIIKAEFDIDADIDDYAKLKEIYGILKHVNLPGAFLKKNAAFKRLVLSPDNSFYSKHNRNTKTITLSDQLFTPEFRKKQPFHRIKHVPTLWELLVHEIGHSVEQEYQASIGNAFNKAFGWKIATTLEGIKNALQQGYQESLKAFLAVPKEKLTTIDDIEKEKIANKIKREGNFQKPSKMMKISWYGVTSPREDFAESFTNFILNSANFKKIEPERYAFLKQNLFNGKEYADFELEKSLDRIKDFLKSTFLNDEVKTPLFPDSELQDPYIPLPNTIEEIEWRRYVKERAKRVREELEKEQGCETPR